MPHTPGPWEMTGFQTPNGEGRFRISAHHTLSVDFVACADGYKLGENKANALLFLAAPELLAACEKALAAYDLACKQRTTWSGRDVDEMRAAVAKAKGESA